jgi:hypothetical protein
MRSGGHVAGATHACPNTNINDSTVAVILHIRYDGTRHVKRGSRVQVKDEVPSITGRIRNRFRTV